jgi:flagellar motor protein MotB
MDDLEVTTPPSVSGAKGTLGLFLGLYLLVLAFFILLVSISTQQEVKSKAVMDSLSSTFSAVVPTVSGPTIFSGRLGDVVGSVDFQTELAGVFATAIRTGTVKIIQPGRLMRVTIPVDALFVPGTTQVRESQYPLLDRIIASLSGRPPGLHYDMEFVISVQPATGSTLPIGQTLEMARAGAFARELLSRGVPPDSMAVGLRRGDPTEVVIWFHTRAEGEGRLRFDASQAEERTRSVTSPAVPAGR